MATRRLEVVITGSPAGLKAALGQAETGLAGFQQKAQAIGQRMKSVGMSMSLGITLPVLALAKVAFDELKASEDVAAQTEARIKSTGGVANVTAKHVERLSSALLHKSGVDDELIHSGANLLLTFKNVRNEVGEGNAIFDRATTAALDLSKAGFGDMTSTSKILGKALNDPVRGMTALSRAGVTFSDEQKFFIAKMVESGDVLGAQKLILGEVESQVGGSAKAYGKTLPGQISRAVEELKNSGAAILKDVLPALTQLAKWIAAAARWFSNLPGPVKTVTLAIVGLAAVLGPLILIMGSVIGVLAGVAGPFIVIGGAIAALIAGAVALGIYWDEVWKFVAENPYVLAVLAPLGMVLLPIIALVGIIKVLADNWDAIWKFISDVTSTAWGIISSVVSTGANIVSAVVNALGSVISRVAGFWSGVFDAWAEAWGWIIGVVKGGINQVIGLWNSFVGFWNGVNLKLPEVDLGPLGSVGGGSFTLPHLPRIPTLHEGGVFMAPPGQGEGLALLRNGERVLTPEQDRARQSSSVVVNVHASTIAHDRDFEDLVTNALIRARRMGVAV